MLFLEKILSDFWILVVPLGICVYRSRLVDIGKKGKEEILSGLNLNFELNSLCWQSILLPRAGKASRLECGMNGLLTTSQVMGGGGLRGLACCGHPAVLSILWNKISKAYTW